MKELDKLIEDLHQKWINDSLVCAYGYYPEDARKCLMKDLKNQEFGSWFNSKEIDPIVRNIIKKSHFLFTKNLKNKLDNGVY